jgi:transposase
MSRHRFDHSVDRSDDTEDVSATSHPRRIEVITGVERRRKWSAQEKAAIVAESLAEGAVISEVARRRHFNLQTSFTITSPAGPMAKSWFRSGSFAVNLSQMPPRQRA